MTPFTPEQQRLARLLQLVEREDVPLQAVRGRLLGADCAVDASRVRELLKDDSGIDRLESFGAKFARMQDTVIDKLIPALLRVAGEPVMAAIDNLDRLERLGLVSSAEAWLEMRRLRIRLAHEYIDQPSDLAAALERACRFTEHMHADFVLIQRYALTHLGVTPAPPE